VNAGITSLIGKHALGLSFVIVRLNLVVVYECFPQIFIRQPSSMTEEEESKSRHNRYPI
jgi:hypothetical protein